MAAPASIGDATPEEVREAVASLVDSGELSEDEGAEVLRQVFAKEEDS